MPTNTPSRRTVLRGAAVTLTAAATTGTITTGTSTAGAAARAGSSPGAVDHPGAQWLPADRPARRRRRLRQPRHRYHP
jgi:hypothetical protein